MRVTAANWSQLAEQARAMAEDMDDALAKKTLLEIAAGYDRLTARALARQGNRVRQPPRSVGLAAILMLGRGNTP
jgi:hypothetical protein